MTGILMEVDVLKNMVESGNLPSLVFNWAMI